MKRRPKILLVTIHACRMPGSGGNVRSHFFARTAAEIGDLTILSLCSATRQTFDPFIQSLCKKVIGGNSEISEATHSRIRQRASGLGVLITPWKENWSALAANCLQHCNGSSAHLGLKKWIFRQLLEIEQRFFFRLGVIAPMPCMTWHREYQKLIQQYHFELNQEAFDILWVEDVYSWPYARDLLTKLSTTPQKLICNTYNIESQVAARTAALIHDASARNALKRDRNQLESMESDAYARSSLTIACSEEDRRNGIELAPRGNFSVIGNGVDTSYFKAITNQQTDRKKLVLLFTGTFTYGPNPQAARYFATEILPLIRQQISDVTFMIAGSRAAETCNQLTAIGLDINCVSDPVDMRPCFSTASLFVVPIQTGGGTRLKILEAMAMGVPVVSTSIGAEGLGAQHGTHLFIGDSAEEFAQRCVELLRDGVLQQRLARNALDWVREKYDWKRLCQQTKTEVESLIDA